LFSLFLHLEERLFLPGEEGGKTQVAVAGHGRRAPESLSMVEV
jgi:hypothetical protein